MKDPIAIFSTEWLAKKFDMDVVMLIRHPVAFVSSIKRLNWQHNFSDFIEQPLLMQDHLHPFEAELKDHVLNKRDIIDQGILLWKLIYFMVDKFRKAHEDFIFVKHEDLSLNPLEEFRTLFTRLNVKLTEDIRRMIMEYSDACNPAEAPQGVMHQLKRNSTASINNWKTRLSDLEVKRIREGVESISSLFYKDEDWLDPIGIKSLR
jgi:hypothetical protein